MKKLIIILLLVPLSLQAQEERKYIRDGYKAFMEGDYNNAEVEFRKAEEVSKEENYIAGYNTSAALYELDKMEDAEKRFNQLLSVAESDAERAKLYHNLGNIKMKEEKYPEAVEMYKKSLRLNPSDEDTRYNLAYALEKIPPEQENQDQQDQDKQEQQNQENQDQQENKEEDGQENEDSENQQQDENGQDQESDEGEEKEQEDGDQNQDKEGEDGKQQNGDEGDEQEQEGQQAGEEQEGEEGEQKQGQPQEGLSKEDAERLMQAILQAEKDVKGKVDKQKGKAVKVKTEKDW